VSGCGTVFVLLLALVVLILAAFGIKGWTAVGVVVVGLAIATWQIVRRLRR
jgi:hypothetical protein